MRDAANTALGSHTDLLPPSRSRGRQMFRSPSLSRGNPTFPASGIFLTPSDTISRAKACSYVSGEDDPNLPSPSGDKGLSPPNAEGETGSRQQALYFRELVELKIGCDYARMYREQLRGRITAFAAARALTSSSAIAAWAVVQAHPLIWGGIIAATQVADALKETFPFSKRFSQLNDLVSGLEALFIERLHEWEGVYAGSYSNEEITDHRRTLMESRLRIEQTCFPDGDLPTKKKLLADAERSAAAYFQKMFGTET